MVIIIITVAGPFTRGPHDVNVSKSAPNECFVNGLLHFAFSCTLQYILQNRVL